MTNNQTPGELSLMTVTQLRELARDKGLEKVSRLTKAELISLIGREEAPAEEQEDAPAQEASAGKSQTARGDARYSKLKDSVEDSIEMEGLFYATPGGFGFLKESEDAPDGDWVYVSASQVSRFRLVNGNRISGKVRPRKGGEKYRAMLFLESVNGVSTQQILKEEREERNKINQDNARDMSLYEKYHTGIFDLNSQGYGFLRKNYLPGPDDIYVDQEQVRNYRLRCGDEVTGRIRAGGENEKSDALLYVETINGQEPTSVMYRPEFERLLPVFPDEKLNLSTGPEPFSTRILDIFAPIGKGQRGLIVSPPKAGKTVLLKEIALAIRQNYPDIKLIILLVDERPEEVTDMQRSVDCEVVSSTFDQKPENHVKAAEMVLERSKRLVELGKDVVILVDSITRLARANNVVVNPSGRTLSGGLDPESLYFPKKFFGSARNIEGGGSLTILATALVDTGSRMDDVIFEEFKGTGNMEIRLERELAENRIFPAIDIKPSGTRKEELLLSPAELDMQYTLRRAWSAQGSAQFTDRVIGYMKKYTSNADFASFVLRSRTRTPSRQEPKDL